MLDHTHIDGFGLASNCPHCGGADCWYEIGQGDKPGYESIRLHCRTCGHEHKQDVLGDGFAPVRRRDPC